MTDTLQIFTQQIDTVHIADTIKTLTISPEYNFQTWLRTPNTIIAISAIVISIIGLFLSSFHNRRTFKLTKKHNMLSVRPFLHYSGKIDSNAGKITYHVMNKGLGPAIVNTIRYKYKGHYYNNHMEFLQMLKNSAQTKQPVNLELYYNEQNKGTIISPDDSLRLLELTVFPSTYTDSIGDIIAEIKVEIMYEDIYREIYSNK